MLKYSNIIYFFLINYTIYIIIYSRLVFLSHRFVLDDPFLLLVLDSSTMVHEMRLWRYLDTLLHYIRQQTKINTMNVKYYWIFYMTTS